MTVLADFTMDSFTYNRLASPSELHSVLTVLISCLPARCRLPWPRSSALRSDSMRFIADRRAITTLHPENELTSHS